MARVFKRIGKAAAPAAACFMAIWMVVVARAGDKPQLAGRWSFNADQSDNAQQKISDAQNTQRDSNGGGYPGGGNPQGGGVGYPRVGMGWPIGGVGLPGSGGGHRGGGPGTHDRVSSEDWDRLGQNPEYLRIDQRSDQVVVTDDSDHAQTFYPDGKKRDDKDANGNKVSTKTEWQGDTLVVETKLSHSTKLTQTFRVGEDGKQLYVVSRLENPSLQGPVTIRRVYDLAKAASQ